MHVYKERALEALKGNWGMAVVVSLIAAILGQGVEMATWALSVFSYNFNPDTTSEATKYLSSQPFVVHLTDNLSIDLKSILYLLFAFVTFGLIQAYRDLLNEGTMEIGTLFQFKELFGKGILLSLLTSVYVFLWMLLLIIPGIIKSFAYAMGAYLINRNPDLTPKEALKLSEQLMDGHKMDLFLLRLSFIGWILLSLLTCGIGLLFVIPYLNTTIVAFYDDIYENGIDQIAEY